MSDNDDTTGSASGRLFDLRELIIGIFFVFGVVLVIVGAVDGPAEIAKAAGVRINLWTGIGMIVVAGIFLLWRLWRPLKRENLAPVDDSAGAADAAAPQDPIAGR